MAEVFQREDGKAVDPLDNKIAIPDGMSTFCGAKK